uniref:Uncharacterized protein n=1 Tax=Romanomermis culicivorax TaxID=13658 RepID=A0A915KV44_ROMCU
MWELNRGVVCYFDSYEDITSDEDNIPMKILEDITSDEDEAIYVLCNLLVASKLRRRKMYLKK